MKHQLAGVALLLTACAPTAAPAPGAAGGLLGLLPDPAGLQGLKPAGDPQQAAGNELFELINGGAELYLKHGFERAVVQEYESEEGLRFSLDIYRMKDDAGAEAIYAARGGATDATQPIGKASTFEDYYGLYLEGRYYFSITAMQTSGELRPPIEELARAAVLQIQQQK